MTATELICKYEKPRTYTARRHQLMIDLEIIDAVFRGNVTKTSIGRVSRVRYTELRPILDRLESQGYLVSAAEDFRKGFNKQRGKIEMRFAVTERAKLWRLIMQQAEALAPK